MPAEGVRVSWEKPRGCGYRKEGGLYLIAGGVGIPCPALPLEVTQCPCCGAGIKPARGWAWFDPSKMFKFPCPPGCERYQELGRCQPFQETHSGLIWIGSKFYKSAADWMRETEEMGVSRRISQTPKDLEIGKTWVFVGHRDAIEHPCPECAERLAGKTPEEFLTLKDDGEKYLCKTCKDDRKIWKPGIFHVFKPTRIEKVVSEDVSEKEVAKLRKRGIEPVIVKHLGESGTPFLEDIEGQEQQFGTNGRRRKEVSES